MADYAHEQANALADAGVAVTLLTTPERPVRNDCRYQIHPILAGLLSGRRSRWVERILWGTALLGRYRSLNREIRNGNYQTVLMESYVEYLAPLWARQFVALARKGVKFGAIVHDPVRDYRVGPVWWHQRSIAAGYAFLSEAFVHEKIHLDTVKPVPNLRTTVIPHGPYRFPKVTGSREETRHKWSLPDGALAVLSFGHIRDGKNLDLVIRAMADLPSVYLVVAGKEQSPVQKPIGYYQNLAKTLGVQERCRWIHGHVPEDEVGNLFAGADLMLLTYSKDFRSASGVLNAAVTYRKPCVASSGGGNLRSVVEGYQLGWFVAPDDLAALRAGIVAATREPLNPRWDAYESENSWTRNASLVKERMFTLS